MKTNKKFALLYLIFILSTIYSSLTYANTFQSAGSYETGNGDSLPLIITSDGKSWSVNNDIRGFNGHAYINNGLCENNLCLLGGANELVPGKSRRPLIINGTNETWQLSSISNLPLMTDGFIEGLACTNEDCLAGGFYQDANGSHALLLSSHDLGQSWTYSPNIAHLAATSSNIQAITCSDNICIAVGYTSKKDNAAPLILRSTDAGLSWTSINVDITRNYLTLSKVKCADKTCVAIGNTTNSNFKETAFLLVSHDKGNTWKNIPLSKFEGNFSSLKDVTLTKDIWIAVGSYTRSEGAEKILILTSKDEGNSWSAYQEPHSRNPLVHGLATISCNSSTCITAGTLSYYVNDKYLPGILVSHNQGNTWEPVASVTNFGDSYSYINAVNCTETNCVASGNASTLDVEKPLILVSNGNGTNWAKITTINNLPKTMYRINLGVLTPS